MPDYTDYSTPVENTFMCQSPTVDDLIAWLMLLPPETPVPSDVMFRYSYVDKALSVQQIDAL